MYFSPLVLKHDEHPKKEFQKLYNCKFDVEPEGDEPEWDMSVSFQKGNAE